MRSGGLLILAIVVVEYLVLQQMIGASDDISLLASAEPVLLVVALILEICSLASYSALTRATLPLAGRPPPVSLRGLDPALVSVGAAFSVTLPGALTWRLLQFWLPVSLASLT